MTLNFESIPKRITLCSGYMWNKLFQNYVSHRRRTTEILLFQRVEPCLKLFHKFVEAFMLTWI